MSRLRPALAGLVVSATAVALAAPPAAADPQALEEARQQLEQIQQEASAIDQQIIEAIDRAERAQSRLDGLTTDLDEQRTKVESMSDSLGEIAVMQMQSGGLDVTTQLLTSSSETDFLAGLAAIQNETDRGNADIQAFQLEQARLDALQDDAERTNEALQSDLQRQRDLAEDYEQKLEEAQEVYDQLEAEEAERLRREEEERERREAEAARLAQEQQEAAAVSDEEGSDEEAASEGDAPDAGESAASAPAGGSRGAQAVREGMTRVGSSYVWGTSGPSTFDCSGFTSWAYRQVGISLPRSSRAQMNVGTPVSRSELQPGDLVFYYSPVSHVGLYIGDGMIVDAANPRSGVRVTSLDSMPYSGARRVA